jgi:carbon monoxide dehydrogenase subunit G
MTVVTERVEVNAPPACVWQVVSDPRNLPMWDRHITGVRGVPRGGVRDGTEYTTEIRFMGFTTHIHARVLALEDEHYAKIQLSGLMDGVVETTVEPLGRGRTYLVQRVSYRFAGGPLGAFAAQAIRSLGAGAILRRGVLAQKRQAEIAAGRA